MIIIIHITDIFCPKLPLVSEVIIPRNMLFNSSRFLTVIYCPLKHVPYIRSSLYMYY